MKTWSLKTVQVTDSRQVGVVSEPLYRKNLVLSSGSKCSNVKAGTSVTNETVKENNNSEKNKKLEKCNNG